MQFSSRAVMLLTLVVCITQSQPISGNADTDTEVQGSTVRPGEDSNRQHSGRHWTTSLSGPYQKIVYSGGDGGGSSPIAEDGDVSEQDRKQRRIHKLSQEIDTSSSSSVSVIQNVTHDSSSTERVLLNTTKLETVRNRNHRNLSSRRIANHHPVDSTTRSTAASNKKRRRLSHFNAATTTPSPSQTMPHSWYTYFRPLEQDLPEDDILPFLDFGRKLSPSLPTPPSSINSIENKSSATRSKSKDLHSTNVNINSTPVDEDVVPEDMDVTYVKKVVERNFAPRVPIQTHAPGISNYYRRRQPPATSRATADNLVATSTDCSSPSTGHNNNTKSSNQSIRNINRQHNSRQTQTENGDESKCDMPDIEKPKEMLNSSANLSDKNVAENFNAAESSLFNSVKQFETLNSTNTVNVTNSSNITSGRSSGYNQVGNLTTVPNRRTESNVTTQEDSAKIASTSSPNPQLTTRILSTAVVTSVSLKESSFNNSENPVTAPPPPQPPLPTRLARVVNSTIDRTNDSYRNDNSAANHGNDTHQSDISGKQSITDFNSKVIPAVQSNRSNRTPAEESTSKINSRERVSPLGASHTPSRSNHSSTADNKSGTQLTSNFTSSESETRTKPWETNHPSVTDNSDKQLLPRNLTSSESVIRTEPSEANHPTVTDNSGKQMIRNLTSSESEVRTESLQTNRTFIAEKSDRELTSYLSSSEGAIPVQPPLQVNHTSRSEKNGKQLVTVNLTTESVVPIESSQPTGRLNHTSKIENSTYLTSERLSPTESPQTNDNTNHTVTVEKTGTNVTDNLTPVVGLISAHTSLTMNSSGNDGNVPNTEGSVDPLSVLETTTTSLLLTPLTNDSSLRTTNDTKESPTTSEDMPKTGPAIHEEHVLVNSSGDGTNRSSEVTVNATKDESVYVDNNTIADLPPTDVYYDDYEEPNMEPDDSNDTTIVIHGETPEEEEEEEEVDGWLQNSTIIGQNVEVAYPQPTIESSTYILVGLSIIPILLGAAVAARFFLLRNKKKVLDESEYSSEYNRSPLSISNASPLPTKLPRVPQHLGWEMEKSPPSLSPSLPSSKWEFPREKLRLQTVLGQGNFGQVWKAEADDISGHEGLTRLVAVKSVKESASAREREDLLRELGIMQDLGSHPNVVTLLGCCTEKEPYYLIMEYVMYGKLLTFLRDHRTRAHYYNFSDVTDALTSRDLTVFMYCVARGMDYLSNKGIIHRDLAARNVLVDHNKLCKIADFGMSRNVRDTGQIYEQRQSKGALPIRWMAPESLHYSLFTHKSDVWSFGILLWEIITLGSTPYATMGAREVMRRVRDGYRLERPSHCRPELFRVISRCWHADPNKRPTFAELKHEIGQLLTDTERGSNYIDLDSLHEEMKQSSQGSTLQRNQ